VPNSIAITIVRQDKFASEKILVESVLNRGRTPARLRHSRLAIRKQGPGPLQDTNCIEKFEPKVFPRVSASSVSDSRAPLFVLDWRNRFALSCAQLTLARSLDLRSKMWRAAAENWRAWNACRTALFETRKVFLGDDGSRSRLAERGAVNRGARAWENFSRFHQNQTGYAEGIAELFADLCRAAEGFFAKRGFDMEVIQMAGLAAPALLNRAIDYTTIPSGLPPPGRAERRSKSFASHR